MFLDEQFCTKRTEFHHQSWRRERKANVSHACELVKPIGKSTQVQNDGGIDSNKVSQGQLKWCCAETQNGQGLI